MDHPFRPDYTVTNGVLGFRAPSNFPDAAPEDSFFIMPITVKLVKPDCTQFHRSESRFPRRQFGFEIRPRGSASSAIFLASLGPSALESTNSYTG